MIVDTLIEEMKAVKADNPTLERSEILRIFNISALQDLTNVLRSKNG